jgi:hypothetical protein
MWNHITNLTRLASVLTVAFFLAIVISDGPPNPLTFTLQQKLFALTLVALYAGLAWACFRPRLGGSLTLISWLILAMLTKRLPLDTPFLLPALLSLLHLIAARKSTLPFMRQPVWLHALAAGLILLGANETFGSPPAFAGASNAPAALTGVWTSAIATFEIDSNANLSGRIDGVPITSFHLQPNRTWFGRLIHWRTDYRIRGTLADGQSFQLLLDRDANQLRGTLERSGLGRYLNVEFERR